MPQRRNPTEQEKNQILARYGRNCFVTGHPISESEELEYDHILPVYEGGPTVLDNLAPVCKTHHRQKGTLSLAELRDKLRLAELFADGQPKYLDQVAAAKDVVGGQRVQCVISEDETHIRLFFHGSDWEVPLYQCPITKWRYFYAMIPVAFLKNDRDLQPRPLRQKELFELYKHFHRNTQLAPSICRLLESGDLLLFDGQHKAAAQIWAGRSSVECKVYVYPNPSRLKVTNLEAHEAYRQMKFFSGELMAKYAGIFKEDWEEFLATSGLKSEATFIDFLMRQRQLTRAAAKKELENAIHERVISDPDNRLSPFISRRNRTRNEPLTHNQLKVSLFRHLICQVPTESEFEGEEDFRELEQQNLVRLMSVLANKILVNKWNPERDDEEHRKAERICSAGAVRAWSGLIRDLIFAFLHLSLISTKESGRVLYRPISEEQFADLEQIIGRLFDHPVWIMPDTNERRVTAIFTANDDVTAANLLKQQDLTVAWLLGVG